MTREGYANLSVPADRHNQVRRRYEKQDRELSFAQWAVALMESSIEKLDYMQNTLSHIRFSEMGNDGMAIFDKKKDMFVRVHIKNSKDLICSADGSKPCEHKIYAAMHPQFLAPKSMQ